MSGYAHQNCHHPRMVKPAQLVVAIARPIYNPMISRCAAMSHVRARPHHGTSASVTAPAAHTIATPVRNIRWCRRLVEALASSHVIEMPTVPMTSRLTTNAYRAQGVRSMKLVESCHQVIGGSMRRLMPIPAVLCALTVAVVAQQPPPA